MKPSPGKEWFAIPWRGGGRNFVAIDAAELAAVVGGAHAVSFGCGPGMLALERH